MLRRALLAAAAVVLLGAAAPMAPGGITFTIRSTTGSDGNAGAPSTTFVQALDGTLRFEGESDGQSAQGNGSYVLISPAGRRMSIVLPDSRQYMEINFDSTAGVLVQAMAATSVVADVEVSGTSVGAGGTVNGYDTRHYRITTSYSEVEGGSDERTRVRLVEDFWVTSALAGIPDPMEAFTRAFGGKNGMPAIGGTVNELIQRRGDAQRRLFTGLPIKTVVRTSTTTGDETREEISTTEILDLRRVDLDPAAFRVPEGYTRFDMRQLANVGAQLRGAFSGMGPARDTTSVGSLVKDAARGIADETTAGAKEGAADAARDAAASARKKARGAVGGLLRGRRP